MDSQEHYEALMRINRAEQVVLNWPHYCKAMRVTSGLTQEYVATAMNVTTQTIANYENGRRAPKGIHAITYVDFLERAVATAGIAKAQIAQEMYEIRLAHPVPHSITEALARERAQR